MQATLLFKLDILDKRLQVCEEHILHRHSPPHPHPTPQDPKGKAPLHPSSASPPFSHHSPHASPMPSHQPSPPIPPSTTSPSPQPQPSSPVSPASHGSSFNQFELVARTPPVLPISPDSEATHSDPPLPPPPPSALSTPPFAPVRFASALYQRRKKPPASR